KPAWQRLIVMLGGIIVNVIVGIIIFIGLTYFVGEIYYSKDDINQGGTLVAGELAKQIGLQDGDKIIKINGKEFTDYQDVYEPLNLIESNASYTIERNGEIHEIKIPDNFIESFNKKELTFITFRFPAIVGEVSKGSMAEKVGVQPNDKFVSIQGQPVQYFDDIARLIDSVKGEIGRAHV